MSLETLEVISCLPDEAQLNLGIPKLLRTLGTPEIFATEQQIVAASSARSKFKVFDPGGIRRAMVWPLMKPLPVCHVALQSIPQREAHPKGEKLSWCWKYTNVDLDTDR